MKRKRVGILDFCGPYEVFTVTLLDENRRRGVVDSFDRLVRPLGSLVTADRGLLPQMVHCSIEDRLRHQGRTGVSSRARSRSKDMATDWTTPHR